jgi:hypothetical protein
MQVATGLGLFSTANLAAGMLRTHETSLIQYQHLNQAVIGAWICCLLYWTFSFAQKEAKRREFTPEMQRILLAAAGAAHATRVALTETEAGKERKHYRQ